MLTIEDVERIEFRWENGDAGVPAIAAEVGCSESTVLRVIHGKHSLQLDREQEPPDSDELPTRLLARPVRCQRCGSRINMLPCVLCSAKGREKATESTEVTESLCPR